MSTRKPNLEKYMHKKQKNKILQWPTIVVIVRGNSDRAPNVNPFWKPLKLNLFLTKDNVFKIHESVST